MWTINKELELISNTQLIRYDNPPSWDGGKNCAGTFTPGAQELANYIKANFSGIKSILGYSCRQNTANLKQTSVHGTGRALDIMITPIKGIANSEVGDKIANWLIRNAQSIGIQFIIWNKSSWNGSKKTNKLEVYSGPVPHIDHIHVEINNDGANKKTPWFKSTILQVAQ